LLSAMLSVPTRDSIQLGRLRHRRHHRLPARLRSWKQTSGAIACGLLLPTARRLLWKVGATLRVVGNEPEHRKARQMGGLSKLGCMGDRRVVCHVCSSKSASIYYISIFTCKAKTVLDQQERVASSPQPLGQCACSVDPLLSRPHLVAQ